MGLFSSIAAFAIYVTNPKGLEQPAPGVASQYVFVGEDKPRTYEDLSDCLNDMSKAQTEWKKTIDSLRKLTTSQSDEYFRSELSKIDSMKCLTIAERKEISKPVEPEVKQPAVAQQAAPVVVNPPQAPQPTPVIIYNNVIPTVNVNRPQLEDRVENDARMSSYEQTGNRYQLAQQLFAPDGTWRWIRVDNMVYGSQVECWSAVYEQKRRTSWSWARPKLTCLPG